MSKDYYRAYVALSEEQSGYSLPGRKAFGKAVIEARGAEGKLIVSVQGLRPKVPYKVYLIAKNIGAPTSRYSGVFICDMPVSEKGAGEVKLAFDAHDVGGSGFMAGLFTVVAVLVHNAPNLTAPLVGYSGDTVFWKNGFEVYTKKEEARSMIHDEPANPEPAVTEDFMAYAKNYMDETDEYYAPEPEPVHEPVTEFIPEPIPEPVIVSETENHINVLFAKNAKMSPFITKDPDIEWVRIAPEHVSLFGLTQLASSEFLMTAYKRYRHLVLGRVGGARYIIGVPDMYGPQSALVAEEMGMAFKRCDGGEVAENSYGYWLVLV
jgi:hypothetical protein